MPISWPDDIAPSKCKLTPISAESVRTSGLTNTTQRGSSTTHMWQMALEFPPLTADQTRRARSILARASQDDIIFRVLQPDIPIGVYGSVTVGSGSTGKTLIVNIGAAGSPLLAGQMISVGGARWYQYCVADDTPMVTNPISIPLTSAVRDIHTGAPMAYDPPFLQGTVLSDGRGIAVNTDWHGELGLVVVENR